MTRNIYALLVGIDKYQQPVAPLSGCVNDIMAIKDYLEQRVNKKGYNLHIRKLVNQDATRQAVIDGFQQHLCQATSDDVAFFYYAGHGSQGNAPQEFWDLEPDKLNETIVCYDSRQNGSWDLADKELAKLIAEVAKKDPHITIIMDCCHSGSGSRGDLETLTATRLAPKDNRQRPVDSFIFSLQDAGILLPQSSRSLDKTSSSWAFPQGKHVFFSACLDTQLAKEYNGDGQPRGAFSYFLVDTLKKANGNLTYRDLYKRASALVRGKVKEQSPQLEAVGFSDLEQPFLGGVIAERTPYFTVFHHKEHGWIIDGGAAVGVTQGSGSETTNLAVFPFETPTSFLSEPNKAIGQAHVVEVMPQLSKVEISGIQNLNLEMTFKAIITSLPLPTKGVLISGESEGVELVRAAIQKSNANQPSLYVREVVTPQEAEFQLIARDGKYIISRPADERPLVGTLVGYQQTAFKAIQRLEHMTRWMNILELSSSGASRISPDAVQVLIYQNGQVLQDNDIRLQYEQQNGKSEPPAIKIQLKNNGDKPVYCALLALNDHYAVETGLFEGGGIWLQPQQEVWAIGGKVIKARVKDEVWQQGVTEAKYILKLIVSTAEFDASLLEHKELDSPSSRNVPKPRRNGTLNRLMYQIPSRYLLDESEEETYDDWVTSQISFTSIRPQPTIAIPRGGESIPLADKVQIQGHPSLKAKARLTSVSESGASTRDLGMNNSMLPPVLRGRTGVTPFKFNSATRGLEPDLNVLELSDVQNPDVVTPSNPLKIVVDTPLSSSEELLVFAKNGEFFLPLGRAQATSDGKTEIVLDRLSEPVVTQEEASRSLGGSVRIYFQKVVAQSFGAKYDYPRLAVADVGLDKKVNYINDLQQVQAQVAKAQKIAIYIHGIIGDTESIVPCVRLPIVGADGAEKYLADSYDLVLTYDYENLNTPIEENARLLKQELESIGLGQNHGKTLHIIAHSMGGLVSRWFLEREGGNELVQHLIMLGTPNAGSPWPNVQDLAMTALTFGLNGLTEITWPVPVIGLLLRVINKGVESGVESTQICLQQMTPGSDFLNNLAASPDPGIPYTIIAGNTSIVPAAFKQEAAQKLNRLELIKQKLFDRVVELPFFGQPNDIAVTVDSIKSVQNRRKYQPQIQEVGCDHLVYFSNPVGLTALYTAVSQAFNNKASVTFPSENMGVMSASISPEPTTSENSHGERYKWLTRSFFSVLILLAISGFTVVRSSSNSQPQQQNSPYTSQVK